MDTFALLLRYGFLAALLIVGLAAAIGYAVGGLRILHSGASPGTPLAPELVAERGLGERVTLEQATEKLDGLLVPTDPTLGPPDHVYYDAGTDAVALAWSGRPDPDGNLYSFHACKQPLNYSGLCNPALDEILNDSRLTTDMAQRQAAWDKAAKIVSAERPIIYLLHRKWLYAHNAKLTGYKEYPDGLVRFVGMKM